MRVGRNVEQRKVGKGRVTELDIDAPPANGNHQAVGDFETPERRHERTIFGDHFKYLLYRIAGLFRVNPRERHRTVEHQAQGRPSSR
jgi:hypothetical protein